jgi:tripartite-type tricarboxylate transporter receptor subunit TctC
LAFRLCETFKRTVTTWPGSGVVFSSHLTVWVVFCVSANLALAQTASNEFPNHPIKIIVPQAAGGGTDLIGRRIAQKLSEQLKVASVVENKSGAGSLIGTEYVANSPADGYTLMIGGLFNMVMNKALIKHLSYEPDRDFVPLGYLSGYSFVLLTRPDLPVSNLAEFVKFAKEQSKPITFGTAGIGTLQHVWGEILLNSLGLQTLQVPFKGAAQGYQEMMAGRVDVMFDNMSASKQFVLNGKLKGLALSATDRSPLLPLVPTINETGVTKFTGESWFGVFAPKDTPVTTVNKLRQALVMINKDPEFISQVEKDGGRIINIPVNEQQQFLKDEIVKWVGLVQKNNIKIDE